jgi:hypothetical protein
MCVGWDISVLYFHNVVEFITTFILPLICQSVFLFEFISVFIQISLSVLLTCGFVFFVHVSLNPNYLHLFYLQHNFIK